LAPLAHLAPMAATTRGGGNGSEPFPDPAPEESRRLYLAGLWTERIFHFEDLGPAAPAAAPEPAAVAATAPAVAAAVVEEPAAAPSVAAEPAAAEPGVRPPRVTAPAAAVATVTLAELYLRQGHLKEAQRLFGEVLEREPGNTAAREGLSRLASKAPAAPTPSPAAPAATSPPPAVPEPDVPAQASPVAASPVPAASVPAPPSPVVEPSEPSLAAPAMAPMPPPSPAAPAAAAAPPPAPVSEPVQAAPRQPEAAPLTAAALCGELLAGLDDPRASRKTRRAHLLQSYLARLRRQPRSPHVS